MKTGVGAATPGNVHYRDISSFEVFPTWQVLDMVLMRLIKADKRLAERIQKKLNFSNYQMLCLSWAIGLIMGISIAILFF